MQKSNLELVYNQELLTQCEKRLKGIRDGSILPGDYWQKLAQATVKVDPHVNDLTSPEGRGAFEDFDKLMQRGPTTAQINAEVRQLEKLIARIQKRLLEMSNDNSTSH